jgi:hypothetical protein
MLPVLVEEETVDLSATITKILAAWLGQKVQSEFLKALLRAKRILVVVDGISERDPSTQQYWKNIRDFEPVNALLCTSRSEITFLAGHQVKLYPQPLTQGSVLYFATAIIRTRNSTTLGTLERQVEFVERLAAIVSSPKMAGAITPLLVTLAIARASRLLEQGMGLDNLPKTVADLYFDYLRQLNPKYESVANYLDDSEMLEAAEVPRD